MAKASPSRFRPGNLVYIWEDHVFGRIWWYHAPGIYRINELKEKRCRLLRLSALVPVLWTFTGPIIHDDTKPI